MKLKILGFIVIAIILLSIGYQKYSEYQVLRSIKNYDECAAAKGSIIQESYPETCITIIGKRFSRQTAPTNTYTNSSYNIKFDYFVGPKTYPLIVKTKVKYDLLDLDICGQIYIGNTDSAEIIQNYSLIKRLSRQNIGTSIEGKEMLTNGYASPISIKRLDNIKINNIEWVVVKNLSDEDVDSKNNYIAYYKSDVESTFFLQFNNASNCSSFQNKILTSFQLTN